MTSAGNGAPIAVEALLRDAAPRVLAAVLRRFGDFADSEDAVQEAMIDAARQRPRQGTPENPTGWLVHVASGRMTDRIRSEAAPRRHEETVAASTAPGGSHLGRIEGQMTTTPGGGEDDSLPERNYLTLRAARLNGRCA